jgi:hypothetical protein
VNPHALLDDANLHATCVHEYAHLAVARHFGACGFVTVSPARRRHGNEPHWQGRFQLFGQLADDEWRIVALAGSLAECIAGGSKPDPLLLAEALRRAGALSPCDAALAQGFDAQDVERCLAVILAAWREIVRDAAERAGDVARDYARAFADASDD